MAPLVRLRIYLDSLLAKQCNVASVTTNGIWIWANPENFKTVGDLWPIITKDAYPDLKHLEIRAVEVISLGCVVPKAAPIEILVDAQELLIRYCRPYDGPIERLSSQKRLRRSEAVTPSAEVPMSHGASPESLPFSRSPPDVSRSAIPSWLLPIANNTMKLDENGVPQSETSGISWACSQNQEDVGWSVTYKGSSKVFRVLSPGQALERAKHWLAYMSKQRGQVSTVAAAPGSTAVPSRESLSCDMSSSAERASVRGVALCKGSWKARWRDSDGRQRMRTFGPTPADKIAAEAFMAEMKGSKKPMLQPRVREDVKEESVALSNTGEEAATTELLASLFA